VARVGVSPEFSNTEAARCVVPLLKNTHIPAFVGDETKFFGYEVPHKPLRGEPSLPPFTHEAVRDAIFRMRLDICDRQPGKSPRRVMLITNPEGRVEKARFDESAWSSNDTPQTPRESCVEAALLRARVPPYFGHARSTVIDLEPSTR
jgi:hypothetical protein